MKGDGGHDFKDFKVAIPSNYIWQLKRVNWPVYNH
jgi:hypothetical protein